MFQEKWNLLADAARAGRLPHALLFYGQDKIGKKDFAVNFAKHLTGPREVNPDFIFIDSESESISIKKIRELMEKLSFRPYDADFKVAIINNAHLMNVEAQNCFLKFLEEPTPKTHLILITAFPFLLLDTILSRTQKVRFYGEKKIALDDAGFSKIIRSDLTDRFKFAKASEDANLNDLLNSWTFYLRNILLLKLKGQKSDLEEYSAKQIKDIIEDIQKTKNLLYSTNANQKLALENLFLKI